MGYIDKLKEILQKYRLTVIAVFAFFTLYWLPRILDFPVFPESLPVRYDNLKYANLKSYIIFSTMFVLTIFLNKYLAKDSQDKNQIINIENIANNESIHEVEDKIIFLREEIKKTQREIINNSGDFLTQEQRDNIISNLKEKLIEISSEEFLKDIKEKAGRIVKHEASERLRVHFTRTMKRLSSEISLLEKRSRVNLITGSLTAFVGVSIFMLFVFEKSAKSSAEVYLVQEFAPRLSLVIVIELFAYFFLGLYKSNLSEIKHFHNELTNVEHKYAALEESLTLTDNETVKEIVQILAKTERNFLLKKGESTVSLEDRKVTLEEQKGIINALVGKVSRTKQA